MTRRDVLHLFVAFSMMLIVSVLIWRLTTEEVDPNVDYKAVDFRIVWPTPVPPPSPSPPPPCAEVDLKQGGVCTYPRPDVRIANQMTDPRNCVVADPGEVCIKPTIEHLPSVRGCADARAGEVCLLLDTPVPASTLPPVPPCPTRTTNDLCVKKPTRSEK